MFAPLSKKFLEEHNIVSIFGWVQDRFLSGCSGFFLRDIRYIFLEDASLIVAADDF